MSRRNSTKSAQWVPIREAAAAVDRSYSAVNGWIQKGKLKARTRAGRRVVSLEAAREVAEGLNRNPQASNAGKSANGTMTRAEFADRAGVSDRQVTRWKNDGVIEDYTEEALNKLLEQRAGEQGAQLAIHQSKRRKEAAQAALAELRLAKERNQVYEVESVHRVIRRLADGCRAELQRMARALPPRIARQLATSMDEQAEAEAWVRGLLIDEAREALERLAEITIDVDAKRA